MEHRQYKMQNYKASEKIFMSLVLVMAVEMHNPSKKNKKVIWTYFIRD